MREKIESYIGLARRARALITGSDTCLMAMKKNKLKLLIIAGDATYNTRDKLCNGAKAKGVPYRIFSNREELSIYTGTQNKVVFGITDSGFADVILKEIDLKK